MAVPKKKVKVTRQDALCWSCALATNSTRECSWADHLGPVDGWDALARYSEEYGWVFKVITCPLFKQDMREQSK